MYKLTLILPFPRVFVFPGPRPYAWPPALALASNLYLPALAPNLYLPALAPNLYLRALVPTLYLPFNMFLAFIKEQKVA